MQSRRLHWLLGGGFIVVLVLAAWTVVVPELADDEPAGSGPQGPAASPAER